MWNTVVVPHATTEFGLTIARDTVLVQLETQFLARRPVWDTVLGTQPSLHQFDLLTSASWRCPINEQGLFRGVARRLRDHLRSLPHRRAGDGAKDTRDCRQVIASLLHFVRQSESQLAAGQRLPLSTEILESSFSLFKQLERQHSKGGFTSLLAAYGGLLQATTPASIRQDFKQVSVKEMRTWVSEKLGQTLASKRQTAYREYRHAA